MKIFKASNRTIFSFGFNMVTRRPDNNIICWNDAMSGEWQASSTNAAGSTEIAIAIDPEFVFETKAGSIVAYQPGMCIEMTYIGRPCMYDVRMAFAGSQFVGYRPEAA